jgi:hypothetical protein
MRYLLTSLLCVFTLSLTAQEAGCTYPQADNFSPTATVDNGSCVFDCPDITSDNQEAYDAGVASVVCPDGGSSCPGDLDNDGTVTSSDLLMFLSAFGDTCTNDESEGNDEELFAILFIESSTDAQFVGSAEEDILVYMIGAPFQEWLGMTFGGSPDLSNPHVVADFLYWMDWPGFSQGTSNSPPAQLVAIPQEAADGLDAFGNIIEEFKFVTAEFQVTSPAGSNLQFIALTPRFMANGSMLRYTTIGFDWVGDPVGAQYQTTGVSGASLFDLVYEGDSWPNSIYRIHTNSGSLQHNVYGASGPSYFRGGNYILE